MPSSADVQEHTSCRVCGSHQLFVYLDLGVQSLANAFLHQEDLGLEEFTAPLRIVLCETCGLSQLTHVVSPDRLYRHYLYASGVSQAWKAHCAALARDYTRAHSKMFVLEIAANDGTLLAEFQKRGHRVLGIEPAVNLPHPESLAMLSVFWNSHTAMKVALEYGQADLIIATNVLGHVDHVLDFLEGIRLALKRTGMAIIECPHILPLLVNGAFDTIYHEHLSYWSLGPLSRACQAVGLYVFDCQPQEVHGGTMRYSLCHSRTPPLTDNHVGLWQREHEMQLDRRAPYEEFGRVVAERTPLLREAFRRAGLYGFGASAKGNTLLNYLGATLPAIYDENPLKQGLFTPGQHIPVQPLPADLKEIPALALLSWNWARELRLKARDRGFRGEFLVPIPRPTWSAA